MVKEGVVQLICKNVKSMLKDLPKDSNSDKVKEKNLNLLQTQKH